MFQALSEVTVGGLLTALSEQLGDHPALVYPDRSWTFAQLEADCRRLARALAQLGVVRGERVAVWACNRPEWIMLQFALAKLGAILVTVNTALRSEELGYLLAQSGAETLILMPGFRGVDYLGELARCGVRPRRILVLDGEPPAGMLAFCELWALAGRGYDERVELDDVINMQYTSGTTGFPKGVRLTSRNIVNNGHALGQGLGYQPQDRLCLSVPLFHCFGCVIGVLGAYTHGATLCPLEAFDPLEVLRTIERERCTAVYGVPTMFLAKLEHPEFSRFDLSSLRTGVMAGSLCPQALMRRVQAEMGLAEMTIVYGLTEASPAITQTPRHDPVELRTQTVGRVLPGLEVRIVAPDGTVCEPGRPGELQVRGYCVMEGYHDDPEATARAIDAEGWLATGDQACVCPHGYVRITGRLKDLIIRGGENIAPREIEDLLRTHPDVLDAAVYGVDSVRFGEEVAAAVRLRRPVEVEALRSFCAEHLARFKVPKSLRVVEEFPLTASGKVQKFRLREDHQAWLAQQEPQ